MTATVDMTVEKPRVSSIDLMRGVVMLIMALDHVRDFFSASAFVFDPSDPTLASPGLFFTRWITHFCAPTFVFLSGISIRLSLQRKSAKELSRFLWTRGLWLLFLEFTIIRFSFFFNLYYDFTVIQVIYALGMSMIFMSALIYIKPRVLLIAGVIIVAGHNMLDYARVGPDNPLFVLCTFVYQGGLLQIAPDKFFMVAYPFLPWLGIMLLGFGIAQWYTKVFDSRRRRKLLLFAGLGAIALFVILRAINGYGDPSPWQVQKEPVRSFLSFLNCTKYPVSLLYTLMTIGPVLVLLSFMEGIRTRWSTAVEAIGRVPMFYYVLHFYLIHVLAIATFFIARHKGFGDLNFHFTAAGNFLAGPATPGYFGGLPIGWGFGLAGVYLAWVTVVVIMYPLCRKYNDYKSRHSYWWLSYL